MSISHHVDVDNWTVYVEVTGTVSPAQAVAEAEVVRRDPHASPTMRVLLDCRGATIGVTSDEVRSLALGFLKLGIDPARRVAVVVSSEVAAGLARMFAGYGWLASETFAVFRDLAEAREWLGI